MIPVKEYTDPAKMLADYAALRRRMRAQVPEPVSTKPQAEIVKPKILVFPMNRKVTIEEIADRYRYAHPQCRLFAQSRVKDSGRLPDSGEILHIAIQRFGFSRLDLSSDRRTGKLVRARQITCWLMRHCTTLSLPAIGRKLGGRDHTTIMHAVRKIDDLRERDDGLKALTDELRRQALNGSQQ